MDPVLSGRLRTSPPLRTTSIDSRSDGVVAWQTWWNQDVLAAVADRSGSKPGHGTGWCARNEHIHQQGY